MNNKNNFFWKGFALFLLGVIVGIFFAPIKKGISFCNDNGNNNTFSGNEASFKNDEYCANEENNN